MLGRPINQPQIQSNGQKSAPTTRGTQSLPGKHAHDRAKSNRWWGEKCYGVDEPHDAALPEHDTWRHKLLAVPTVFLLIKHSVQVDYNNHDYKQIIKCSEVQNTYTQTLMFVSFCILDFKM